jgi:hypothetical protein
LVGPSVRRYLLRGDLPEAVQAYQALTGAGIAAAREAVGALGRKLSPQRFGSLGPFAFAGTMAGTSSGM